VSPSCSSLYPPPALATPSCALSRECSNVVMFASRHAGSTLGDRRLSRTRHRRGRGASAKSCLWVLARLLPSPSAIHAPPRPFHPLFMLPLPCPPPLTHSHEQAGIPQQAQGGCHGQVRSLSHALLNPWPSPTNPLPSSSQHTPPAPSQSWDGNKVTRRRTRGSGHRVRSVCLFPWWPAASSAWTGTSQGSRTWPPSVPATVSCSSWTR